MRRICLLCLAAVALADEGVLLQARYAAPEEVSTLVEIERSLTSEGDALMGTAASLEKTTIVYGEKVRQVEEGERTGLLRKYARYETRIVTAFGGEEPLEQVERHPLAGKVIPFARREGRLQPLKEVPQGEDGLDPLLEADWEQLLPGRAVKIGESWTTTKCDTLREILLLELEMSELACTLESVDEETGLATIRLKLEYRQEDRVSLAYGGTMQFSPTLGKVVAFDLKGVSIHRKEGVETRAAISIHSERRIAEREGR